MEQEEFKKLFDNFNPVDAFTVDGWNTSLDNWKSYYDDIVGDEGLPIDRWVKKDDKTKEYLPNFLDTQEKWFGHARIGNYNQVMIYRYTGGPKDKRNNKYINCYKNPEDCSDNRDYVEDDYENRIKVLLKEIATASNVEKIYETENSDKYKDFKNKQILRKITILCSLMDGHDYKHGFAWFFRNETINELAKILEVKVNKEDTFLKKNHAVYEKAKKFADIEGSDKKEDYIKLNFFLSFLNDTSFYAVEFSDFRNNNIIFNGAPGTGKTYGVLKGIEKLQATGGEKYQAMKYVQFHPAYSYQDFIEGIKPMGITDGGHINLEAVNGAFKAFCIHVREENEKYWEKLVEQNNEPDISNPSEFADWPHYYFVVDEINRGNLSNIFGETFTLLESDYRDYDFSKKYEAVKSNLVSTVLSNVIAAIKDNDKLTYKKIGNEVYFGIPFNIHFIGIMNDVDKSIDTFDLALRRRFKWISKYCDYNVIKNVLISSEYDSDEVESYAESCKALNDFICEKTDGLGLGLGKTYEIGHAFFLKIRYTGGQNKITQKKKEEVFENYISGTLKEYIRLVAEETEIDSLVEKAKKAFGL